MSYKLLNMGYLNDEACKQLKETLSKNSQYKHFSIKGYLLDNGEILAKIFVSKEGYYDTLHKHTN